ncbi:MAG: hypothetical protein ABEJ99_04295 [Candidatus Nanohaloarchaea archaeon]
MPGLLENLKKIFHLEASDLVNISIGNNEEKHIHVHSGEGESKVEVDEETGRIDVDLNALNEDEKEKFIREELPEMFEKDEITEFYRKDIKDDAELVENSDQDRIQETLEFFSPIISDEHLETLKHALFVRELWEDDRPIDKKKQDIKQKHGEEGQTIVNLCTAGYFDEEGYLRKLYQDMKQTENYKEGDYQEEFEDIVYHAPFSVFVSRYKSAAEYKNEVRKKIQQYQRYRVEIEFIDLRGIGSKNKKKVKTILNSLEEELEQIEYQRKERSEDGELRIRIDPSSVEGLEN